MLSNFEARFSFYDHRHDRHYAIQELTIDRLMKRIEYESEMIFAKLCMKPMGTK